MAKATIDLTEFSTADDFAVTMELPYAQWLNPQKEVYGLAIKKDQAKIAKLKPDETWAEKTVEFEDDNGKVSRVDFWVTTTPRMVILNPTEQISSKIKGNAFPLMMKHIAKDGYSKGSAIYNDRTYKVTEAGQWKAYRPLLFILLDKNNNFISNPIVFNSQKMSHNSLVQEQLPLWIDDVFSAFKKLGGKVPEGQKPTCTFLSHFIFEPHFDTKMLKSTKGKGSSPGWVCVGYKKPTAETWAEFAISRKSEQSQTIMAYVEKILDYITPQNQEKPKTQDDDVDAITDSDGVIDESSLSPDILAELDKEDPSIAVPF